MCVCARVRVRVRVRVCVCAGVWERLGESTEAALKVLAEKVFFFLFKYRMPQH